MEEEVQLDEMHDRYMRSHGKKASGRGGWMFTTKRMGDVDFDNDKEFYQHPGQETLSKAAAAAKKALGTKNVYVMESVEQIEEVELEEGRNECLKALEGLAKKGGIDKADFQKAHDLYKANKLNDLRKHIYKLDTDPSEAIASTIDRCDSKAFNSMYPRAKAGDYLRKIVLDHGGK